MDISNISLQDTAELAIVLTGSSVIGNASTALVRKISLSFFTWFFSPLKPANFHTRPPTEDSYQQHDENYVATASFYHHSTVAITAPVLAVSITFLALNILFPQASLLFSSGCYAAALYGTGVARDIDLIGPSYQRMCNAFA